MPDPTPTDAAYEAAARAFVLGPNPAQRQIYEIDADFAWHIDYDAYQTARDGSFRAAVQAVWPLAVQAGRDQAVRVTEFGGPCPGKHPDQPDLTCVYPHGHITHWDGKLDVWLDPPVVGGGTDG